MSHKFHMCSYIDIWKWNCKLDNEICDILKFNAFVASLEDDAEEHAQQQQPSTFVTSVFALSSDKGKEDEHVLSDQCNQVREYLGTYEFDQIESFFLDENKQQLTVLHNLLLLSANDLLEALQEKSPNGLQWQISKNGTDKKRWAFPNFTPVDEQQALDEEVMAKKFTWSNKWPRPAVVLSGIFWVASMLSFIGENW